MITIAAYNRRLSWGNGQKAIVYRSAVEVSKERKFVPEFTGSQSNEIRNNRLRQKIGLVTQSTTKPCQGPARKPNSSVPIKTG